MQPILIAPSVRAKLKLKHHVTEEEIRQCFKNGSGLFLVDDRVEHASNPATWWFVARTKRGRRLKIAFALKDGCVHIKSAYETSKKIVDLYYQLLSEGAQL